MKILFNKKRSLFFKLLFETVSNCCLEYFSTKTLTIKKLVRVILVIINNYSRLFFMPAL